MAKIKFLQFYKTLNKKSARDFRKFTESNYFNLGRDFSYFIAETERLKNKELSSKEFIKSISGSLKLSQRTVWNRLHELMKIAERYIAITSLEKNKIQFDNLSGQYFLENQAYGLFNQKYKANIKAFNKSRKGLDSFQRFYEVLQTGGFFDIYNNQFESYAKNLSLQITYHSVSYMINHYLHLTELLQRENITAVDLAQKGLSFLTDDTVENFLNTLKDQKELHGIVSFHYYIYKAFLNKDDDLYYHYAIQSFNNIYDKIDDAYKAMFYQIMINYCIERTNRGDFKYYNNLFVLYSKKLNDGLIDDLRVGNFPVNNFRDYIFVALRLKKIDWIKWFIEKYSHELPKNIRDDEVNLSYGLVHYHELEYEKALKYLNCVKGDNYIHYTDSKSNKLRIFYETRQYEEAFMEVDNYKHYLRTHKEIPDAYKKTYKIFVNEYSLLLKIKVNDNIEEAEMLKHDILNKTQTSARTWILGKLDEMLKT